MFFLFLFCCCCWASLLNYLCISTFTILNVYQLPLFTALYFESLMKFRSHYEQNLKIRLTNTYFGIVFLKHTSASLPFSRNSALLELDRLFPMHKMFNDTKNVCNLFLDLFVYMLITWFKWKDCYKDILFFFASQWPVLFSWLNPIFCVIINCV